MSALSEHLDRYLALRRVVGFKLVTEGRALRDFVRFVEAAGESTINGRELLSVTPSSVQCGERRARR